MKHELNTSSLIPQRIKTLNVFEAFAGIGAQRRSLENIGIKYKIIGLAEWFIPAIISYHIIHHNFDHRKIKISATREEMIAYLKSKPLSMNSKTLIHHNYWNKKTTTFIKLVYKFITFSASKGNIFDISLLNERGLKDIDLLTYSFPCQDLSQQGKGKGMKKESNTRSSLLWEIEKALINTKFKDLPQYLLMENVTAIANYKNINDLNAWINKLKLQGYFNDFNLLNATNFGSPQSRKRAFMISALNNKVKLPLNKNNEKITNVSISSILNKRKSTKDLMLNLNKYELSAFLETKSKIKKASLIGYTTFNSEGYVYDPNYYGPTLTASGANSRIKILYKKQIRKLNARECFKYMGFKSEDYKKLKKLQFLNEVKLIFLCGNSISVETLDHIMMEIKDDWYKNARK